MPIAKLINPEKPLTSICFLIETEIELASCIALSLLERRKSKINSSESPLSKI